MCKVDFSIYIGRFQPFHKGHHCVVRSALEFSKHIIVVCGSSFGPHTPRNPWTFSEREKMIQSCFPEQQERITAVPVIDAPYNNEAWIWMLQKQIRQVIKEKWQGKGRAHVVGLIRSSSDIHRDYTAFFPQWEIIELEVPQVSATAIRDNLFQDSNSMPDQWVPNSIASILHTFSTTNDFKDLVQEQQFLKNYRKGWENSPYPPTFVTADAVVIQSGHILIVKRKAYPGRGLLALPGGFIHQNETVLKACIRELRSETRLKVPEPVLNGSLKAAKTFDDPFRSLRGRTITHAFHFELSKEHKLPKVKGGDDAKQAFWLPLSQLDPNYIFEDHYSIIQDLLGIYINNI